jgi:hypothetical protein
MCTYKTKCYESLSSVWAISYSRKLIWEVVYILEGTATVVGEQGEGHYFITIIKLYHSNFFKYFILYHTYTHTRTLTHKAHTQFPLLSFRLQSGTNLYIITFKTDDCLSAIDGRTPLERF